MPKITLRLLELPDRISRKKRRHFQHLHVICNGRLVLQCWYVLRAHAGKLTREKARPVGLSRKNGQLLIILSLVAINSDVIRFWSLCGSLKIIIGPNYVLIGIVEAGQISLYPLNHLQRVCRLHELLGQFEVHLHLWFVGLGRRCGHGTVCRVCAVLPRDLKDVFRLGICLISGVEYLGHIKFL